MAKSEILNMKNIILLSLMLFPCLLSAQGENPSSPSAAGFNELFLNKTLRVDYFLAGNSKQENVYFREMRAEPYYGGPHKNRLAMKNYGSYRYCLYDSATGNLIFARGFCSLFQEWKGTPEAKQLNRVFPMVATTPFPRKTVNFVIEKRAYETGEFSSIFGMYIRPDDYFIRNDSIHRYKVERIRYSGDPSNHVDIAFLAEGYTEEELPQFLNDSKSMADYFMSVDPYSRDSSKFNFYAVMSPSDESGVSIPGKEIYVNTNIHSQFYTFDMDRYLTSSDTKSIYDIASNVPYDAIFVIVNSKRYGGGGFFNHYAEGTANNQYSKQVAIHEFGHSFAGLADEYYNAEVTYSDFYNTKVEPWEPNITTNVNFQSKWKDLIPAGMPLPTPRTSQYKDVAGMFEGGGYMGKGIYSPAMDCRMKSNEAAGFCPACRRAITTMIRFYTEQDTMGK